MMIIYLVVCVSDCKSPVGLRYVGLILICSGHIDLDFVKGIVAVANMKGFCVDSLRILCITLSIVVIC